MRTTLKWARAGMAAVFFVATVTSGAQGADVKGNGNGKSDFQVGRGMTVPLVNVMRWL